ncbi:MAG: exopolyphosphatase [Candidatus Omnitrophica bacterium]|nr:exopolyphosphatase [Candidatus Omnitrophota bacterium]MCA9424180.1 exopolyphosphatase [Candidatus Omnitrophota bacterium]MCA9430710.1 exopolyphosphatase [Candidatus Omnitrophota bacterium]MCA9434991.1 exopolyphosphatase [Candidatus Omnitrophota bacterium]MCA9448898.1 exopolyphosphatase [Candidatus Omnitrophota bacterium]
MKLVTRADLDGLACAVLLNEVEIIEEVIFKEPHEIDEIHTDITKSHILANLPYHPKCGMWFDHHSSEGERTDIVEDFEGSFQLAPSAARVIYNHYRSHRFYKYEYLLSEVDRIDSAQLTHMDITFPEGWVLLSYILDPRTGLSSYQGYGINNEDLLQRMISLMAEYSADEILKMHDIKQRVKRYEEQEVIFKKMLQDKSRQEDNVIITDTRGMARVPNGNRFLVYTLFPDANISLRIMDGKDGLGTELAIGHSILNRTSFVNVGDLCERYGGGGHEGAGGVEFTHDIEDQKIQEIIDALKD